MDQLRRGRRLAGIVLNARIVRCHYEDASSFAFIYILLSLFIWRVQLVIYHNNSQLSLLVFSRGVPTPVCKALVEFVDIGIWKFSNLTGAQRTGSHNEWKAYVVFWHAAYHSWPDTNRRTNVLAFLPLAHKRCLQINLVLKLWRNYHAWTSLARIWILTESPIVAIIDGFRMSSALSASFLPIYGICGKSSTGSAVGFCSNDPTFPALPAPNLLFPSDLGPIGVNIWYSYGDHRLSSRAN